MQYWERYFAKATTNYSSFAQFLFSGNFIDCEASKHNLVIENGMRDFQSVSSVAVGDMICLIYAHDRIMRSRINPLYSSYKSLKKPRNQSSRFDIQSVAEIPRNRVFSSDDILELCLSNEASDYHFLTCIAKVQGQPIWLGQDGYMDPKDTYISPFSVTHGNYDSYTNCVPFITLIKKRRIRSK